MGPTLRAQAAKKTFRLANATPTEALTEVADELHRLVPTEYDKASEQPVVRAGGSPSPRKTKKKIKKWTLLPKIAYDISLYVFSRQPSVYRVVEKGPSKGDDPRCVFDGLAPFLQECVDVLFAVVEGRTDVPFSPSLDKWVGKPPTTMRKTCT